MLLVHLKIRLPENIFWASRVLVKNYVEDFWTSLILQKIKNIFLFLYLFIQFLPVLLKVPVTGKYLLGKYSVSVKDKVDEF